MSIGVEKKIQHNEEYIEDKRLDKPRHQSVTLKQAWEYLWGSIKHEYFDICKIERIKEDIFIFYPCKEIKPFRINRESLINCAQDLYRITMAEKEGGFLCDSITFYGIYGNEMKEVNIPLKYRRRVSITLISFCFNELHWNGKKILKSVYR